MIYLREACPANSDEFVDFFQTGVDPPPYFGNAGKFLEGKWPNLRGQASLNTYMKYIIGHCTFILYPAGESHSKMKMDRAAAWVWIWEKCHARSNTYLDKWSLCLKIWPKKVKVRVKQGGQSLRPNDRTPCAHGSDKNHYIALLSLFKKGFCHLWHFELF